MLTASAAGRNSGASSGSTSVTAVAGGFGGGAAASGAGARARGFRSVAASARPVRSAGGSPDNGGVAGRGDAQENAALAARGARERPRASDEDRATDGGGAWRGGTREIICGGDADREPGGRAASARPSRATTLARLVAWLARCRSCSPRTRATRGGCCASRDRDEARRPARAQRARGVARGPAAPRSGARCRAGNGRRHAPAISDPGAHAAAAAAAGASCRSRARRRDCRAVGGRAPGPVREFVGFLPAKPAARRKALEAWRDFPHTLVLYEAPHRILECVDDLARVLGPDRSAVLARELTKAFESVHACALGEARASLEADPEPGRAASSR